MEIGPESAKLKKLVESDAYLTTFERAVEARRVEIKKWSVLLAPQLTGKVYVALSKDDSKDYAQVKEAISQQYDINEETYRRRFQTVK